MGRCSSTATTPTLCALRRCTRATVTYTCSRQLTLCAPLGLIPHPSQARKNGRWADAASRASTRSSSLWRVLTDVQEAARGSQAARGGTTRGGAAAETTRACRTSSCSPRAARGFAPTRAWPRAQSQCTIIICSFILLFVHVSLFFTNWSSDRGSPISDNSVLISDRTLHRQICKAAN